MIITGYQGIGKSTLAKDNDKIIDLESSSFWKTDENGNKSRPDDWHVYYCQIAEHLSKQGYIVFVSCHQEVRDYLSKHSNERFCAIFPALSLEDKWLRKLKDRYTASQSPKDLRAYEQAKKQYETNIDTLWNEYDKKYYHDAIVIQDMNYNLAKLVNALDV